MQAKNSLLVNMIMNRLIEHLNVQGKRGLAEYLDKPATTIYGWKRNGKIADIDLLLTKIPNINKKWLETGTGPMLNEEQPPAAPRPPPLPLAKIAATITPGNALVNRLLVKKAEKPAEQKSETEPADAELLHMCAVVLASDTVYRPALASNARAFYKAVKNEEEMASMNDELQAMRTENKENAKRLERIEDLLLAQAGVGQKRDSAA